MKKLDKVQDTNRETVQQNKCLGHNTVITNTRESLNPWPPNIHLWVSYKVQQNISLQVGCSMISRKKKTKHKMKAKNNNRLSDVQSNQLQGIQITREDIDFWTRYIWGRRHKYLSDLRRSMTVVVCSVTYMHWVLNATVFYHELQSND